MNTLIDKYNALYNDMAQSADSYKMHIFGDAEKTIFTKLAAEHPDIAEEWLEMLEPSRYHNYLNEAEAIEIASALVNQNGSKGAHWDYNTFKGAVESLGGRMEEEPYYNCYALWVTANMLYSDHYHSVSEYVPNEDMPRYFYLQAVEKLKDADRPRYIRHYFHLE